MSETLTATHYYRCMSDIFIERGGKFKTHKKKPFVIKLMNFSNIKKCGRVFERKSILSTKKNNKGDKTGLFTP